MRGQMLDWEYFHETNIYVTLNSLLSVQLCVEIISYMCRHCLYSLSLMCQHNLAFLRRRPASIT